MKKHLLTLMMLLMGSVAWAQTGGWTVPSNPSYTSETVVWVAIDCGDYNMYYYTDGYVSSYYEPQVAAFVDGELRGVATQYVENQDQKINLYGLRVAGSAADDGKEITFKIYDQRSGIIYPLTEVDGRTVQHGGGDKTENLPSEHLTLTFTPAVEARLFLKETEVTETDPIVIRVNETKLLDNYVVKVYDADGKVIAVETPGVWDIYPNSPNSPYVQQVETEDGSVKIKGVKETPKSEDTGMNIPVTCGHYIVGGLAAPLWVRVLPEYFPVTSIEIEDVNLYWKGNSEGLFIDNNMVVYNNGESTPTNPGIKIVSSSNPAIAEPMRDAYLSCKGIGSSVITVAALDNEDVTTTFTVNVLSGLESIQVKGNGTCSYNRNSSGEETINNLPTPIFNWIMDESGAPVVGNGKDESYTLSSSDPSILRIDGQEVVSLKKGTATITYTSNYDPTKTATLTVKVSQAPNDVKIIKVGTTTVTTGGATEPIIDVALGVEVTAEIQITPADADIENLAVNIVDNDNNSYENVEVGEPVANGDGTYNVIFKFNAVPDKIVRLKAAVNQFYDQVRLNVIQSVTDITTDVPEEITLWLTEDEIEGYTGTINVTVLPETATNKELEVSTSDENIVSVAKGNKGYTYTVHAKGEATITFTSVDNSSVSAECVITVKKKVEYIELEMEESDLFNDGMFHSAYVYFYPEDADYDVDKLTAYVNNEAQGDIELGDWQFVTVEEYGTFDGSMHFGIAGLALCDYAQVIFSYDAAEQGDETSIETSWEGRVIEKIRFDYGWNWISMVSAGISLYDIEPSLDEARSQTELAIVDPEWGLFGYLSWLDPYEAYKVKIKDDAEVLEYIPLEGGWMNPDGTVDDKVLEHGWNWESYPYEYDYAVADIFNPAQFAEGDIILSKDDGMATIVDGAWEGNLDMLRYHQGYLIYSNTEGEYSVTMPNRYSLPQGSHMEDIPRAQRRDRSVWSYDGSRFANTMAIIGQIDIEDAEDYTIGAFVGDECRGEGKFVNGRAYITAAGKAGEEVTLRLHHRWTGEVLEVEGAVAFSDMAGSVKAPVCFNAGKSTAIEHVAAGALTVQGNVALAAGTIQVYDIQGKVVAEGFQRVDMSNLDSGIYVVKAGNQSRKVIK